jgi:hypothetical protein
LKENEALCRIVRLNVQQTRLTTIKTKQSLISSIYIVYENGKKEKKSEYEEINGEFEEEVELGANFLTFFNNNAKV